MAHPQETLVAQLEALVAELLAPTPHLFVVGVDVRGRQGGTQKVEVLLDGDNGIGIDEVVEISRALGNALEEQDLIKGAYNLEVGSPGVDHPLALPRQYAKNVGRYLKLETRDGQTHNGQLTAADTDTLTLTPDGPKKPKKGDLPAEPLVLPYAEVARAVVQVRF